MLWKDYVVVPLGSIIHIYTAYMHALTLYIHVLRRDNIHVLRRDNTHCAYMHMLVTNTNISRVRIVMKKTNS